MVPGISCTATKAAPVLSQNSKHGCLCHSRAGGKQQQGIVSHGMMEDERWFLCATGYASAAGWKTLA
ncbi:MAG: hypothetical protein ACK50J_21125 [Planctomyces sp.]